MKIENASPVAKKIEVKDVPAKNQVVSFKDLIDKQTGQVKEALSQQEKPTKTAEIPVENKAEETSETIADVAPKYVDLSVVVQMLLGLPQSEVPLANTPSVNNSLTKTVVNQISAQADAKSNVWQMLNLNMQKQSPANQSFSQAIVQTEAPTTQPQEIVMASQPQPEKPIAIAEVTATAGPVIKAESTLNAKATLNAEKVELPSVAKVVEGEKPVVQTNIVTQEVAKQGKEDAITSKIISQDVKTEKTANGEKINVEEKPMLMGEQVQLKAELPKDITIIKISDEATKLDHTATNQFANTITTKLSEGKSEFTMQLFPANLGRVAVKLIAENGNIVVQLIADNPKTQSLLFNSSSDIRELVFNSTNTPTTVIATSEQSPMQQNYTAQQENQKNQQQSHTQQNKQANQDGEIESMDFLSLIQQMNEKSLYHQITI